MIVTPEFTDGILAEYPRPQFKRDSYYSLNDEWEYAITDSSDLPQAYDGKILVPYSPESALSGVCRQLKKHEFLHYRKAFVLSRGFNNGRVFVNFGACDQVCEVFLNGHGVGKHSGGYTPFAFELTEFLTDGENILTLVVTDNADSAVYGRGKQRYKRGGIWYTAISGLWQSVWLESTPEVYFTDLLIKPDIKNGSVNIKVTANDDGIPFTAKIYDGDTPIAQADGICGKTLSVPVRDLKEWTPDSPELYSLVIESVCDRVQSYFGMREFSLVERGGMMFTALNGKPILHNGLLDQGYYGEGIYTPKTNRTMYDLLASVKSLGYNMLRKHIKIEPALWYYYCDTLGILVWQDMVNGGEKYKTARLNLGPFINLRLDDSDYKAMGRGDPASREQYYTELRETVGALKNVVSLCLWTPFNEGWGQFDALEATKRLKELDDTRLIDHASGWQDYGGGDINSRHVYFRKPRLKNDFGRALGLTEFGGFAFCLQKQKRVFGYTRIRSKVALEKKLKKLYLKDVAEQIKKSGLCALVYTQLSDVEDEVNGIFTAVFKLKISAEALRQINAELYRIFDDTVNGVR